MTTTPTWSYVPRFDVTPVTHEGVAFAVKAKPFVTQDDNSAVGQGCVADTPSIGGISHRSGIRLAATDVLSLVR